MDDLEDNEILGGKDIVNVKRVDELDKDDFETLLFDHNPEKDQILSAMEIVKQYIIKNKRILTGGMAIDMALREKGTVLYKDNKIPDYDFYSPTFHVDAYTIGEILSEKYEGISVIPALHVSTMKVRVNFVVVADITYIPQKIYDQIPTVDFQGMLVVHPQYQMIDQHLALSLPFENPPMETIMSRWKKDIERYDLLNKYYPINEVPESEINGSQNSNNESKKIKYDISYNLLDGQCIGGYSALLFWLNKAIEDGFSEYKNDVKGGKINSKGIVLQGGKINSKSTKGIKSTKGSAECSLGSLTQIADGFSIESVDVPFSIYSDHFEHVLSKFKGNLKYYNELIDKIPRRVEIISDKTIEVLDVEGLLIGAYKLEHHNVYVANLQSVMCYLLTLGIFYKNKTALHGYKLAQKILYWAAENYTKKDTKYSKYLPTVETYGKINWGISYTSSIDREMVFLRLKKEENSKPRPAFPEKLSKVNSNLYKFDPTKSKFYQIDGNECPAFKEENFAKFFSAVD